MILINGRGQLGEALQKAELGEVIIYHTWNIDDKNDEVQKDCFDKFKRFVDDYSGVRIILISTHSKKKNPYVRYKRKAERYLLEKNIDGSVIRLPILVGKNPFKRFRDENADAFGVMEVILIEDAVEKIREIIMKDSGSRIETVKGTKIPAKIVKRLIEFGRDGL